MRRLGRRQEARLRGLLDRFKDAYPVMEIYPRMLDISRCFVASDGRVRVPNYWYEGGRKPPETERTFVKAYAVRNGPVIKKFDVGRYETIKTGREEVRADGTIIKEERKQYARLPYRNTLEFRVLSMLCARRMRNTAISEFLDFAEESSNPAGLPTDDKRILRIERTVRRLCGGDFNEFEDNAFLFCRTSEEEAENAVRLNALWMGLIGKSGGSFFDFPPFPYETALARKVFPADFFENPTKERIAEESYQSGAGAHAEASKLFMRKIIERYTERAEDMHVAIEEAKTRDAEKKRQILEFVESRGEAGTDFVELVDKNLIVPDKTATQVFLHLNIEGVLGCVIQEPPHDHLKKPQTRWRLGRLYEGRPYYRMYGNEVLKKMLHSGTITEALGVAIPQLPHYVMSQPQKRGLAHL